MHLSIQAQLDYQRHDLDWWEEVVEKAVNAKVRLNLQPSSKTREIDSRYSKDHRSSAMKEKNEASWEYQDRDKNKTKFHKPLFANIYQLQNQVFKKNKRHKCC